MCCSGSLEATTTTVKESKDAVATAAAAAGDTISNNVVLSKSGNNHLETDCQMTALIEIALPVLVTNLSQAALPLTSFAYAGSLTDAASLAGLGLGVSVCNITGMCIYYGMGTGIELLCAQAFGAKNNRLVGLAFARGTLMAAFAFVPVGLLWFRMERVLLALGQPSSVANITGNFCKAYLWGMVPYTVFDNLKRCLQAQSVVGPTMIVAMLGVPANVVFHHLTMVTLGMGVYGAGLALSLTGMFLLVVLIFYTWAFSLGAEGCWSGLLSWEIFQQWSGYLVVCIPGLTGVFVEWTAVEASTFLAGLLGEKQLATQIMILSAYGVIFQFALSMCIAVNIRVGNLLGAGDANRASGAAMCGIRLSLLVTGLLTLGLGLGSGQWPRLYGGKGDALDSIISLAPVFLVAQMIDMMQYVCSGILKGMGYQRIQAIAAGVGFWIVGIPLSAYLGVHKGWGLKGLWGSMATAEGPLLAFYLLLLRSADWNHCAASAATRIQGNSGFSLVGTAPSSPQNGLDCDSDCDSAPRTGEVGAGAGGASTPWWGGKNEDEEKGFGYYGGGESVVVVSKDERSEWAHKGESSKLMPAGPLAPSSTKC